MRMASTGYSIPSEQVVSQARETLLAQYRSKLAEESLRRSQSPVIDVEAQGSTRKQEPAAAATTVNASTDSAGSILDLRSGNNFGQFGKSQLQQAETDDGAALYKPPSTSTSQVSTTASPHQRGVFVDITV
jgi:hypothetical protein